MSKASFKLHERVKVSNHKNNYFLKHGTIIDIGAYINSGEPGYKVLMDDIFHIEVKFGEIELERLEDETKTDNS